jgi:hypothetical protein
VTRCAQAVAIALLALIGVAACGANRTRTPEQVSPSGVHLNPATVDDLMASIVKAGLAVPNPRDVTQQDCPQIGCAIKTETDTVSIMVFPTPGRAELYAGSTHNVFVVEDVVLTFSPAVPANQRAAYEEAVKRAIE